MSLSSELSVHWQGRYVAVIVDNEVTLSHFAAAPGLPFIRLVQSDGRYRVAAGYPCRLDLEQAAREMKNWDRVDLAAMRAALARPGPAVDCFVLGNNAGQGLSLAGALDEARRASEAVVVFGSGLPERQRYEALGYRAFRARAGALELLVERARNAGRPLALAFLNTIQHDESNYHDP